MSAARLGGIEREIPRLLPPDIGSALRGLPAFAPLVKEAIDRREGT